jgi:TolA-binding protein
MKRILVLLPFLGLIACNGKREDNSKVLAKIGGDSYTQSDFDFMIKTLSQDRQDEIGKDPAARKRQFDYMLKQKLQSMAAQKTRYGKDPSLNGRLELVDKRIVTQNYFQVYLGENAGFTVKELEAYYRAHPDQFKDDSGKVKEFPGVKSAVADTLILAKAPLDSFYNANLKRYEVKASCEVAFIQVSGKKTAAEVSKALDKGLGFSEAVQKYSNHAPSKPNQGKLGRLTQGQASWELNGLNLDSLLFNEGTRLKTGAASPAIKKDSSYVIIRSDSCLEQNVPPLAKIRRQVADDYLSQYKTKLSDNALNVLKGKYGAKMNTKDKGPDPAELAKYYEAHKDNYMSPETYEVYHIESKNQDPLAKKIKGIKDLEGFKKLAGQVSENSWTKPNLGYIGVVKKDHALPDGIGMMPALFPALDTMAAGLVASPMQNPDTRKWHFFWLDKKFPKQAKPFDRVKALVMQDYKAEKTQTIKPEDTLAVYAKGKLIREKDVLFLREEIPPHLQERYTRDALVDFLLTWELSNLEAKALGLTDDIKLKAQRVENQVNYWSTIYQDSILAKNAGLDSATLKRTFEANRPFFTRDTNDRDYRKYARDIAGFLALEAREFDIEYKTNPERYRRDTVALSYDESRFDIFQNLKGTAFARADERMLERLKREFQVVILEPALLEPKITNPQESYKTAQNLHYDRKLDQALELYQRLRDQFPKVESLQDSVCFGMAQIYIEQEKYQQALAEYRRLSYLYPKSSNNYKAMFMVGFIYAEHLKNDSSAVKSFEKMLVQYPKSDLSDDADWMIRNIRSGGKLMPVLEGDTGYVAPDSAGGKADGKSTAKTDSTRAAEKRE